jgi:lyso-ornithine lipid O-acyltransferase
LSRLRGVLVLAAFAGLTLPLMPVQQALVWLGSARARTLPMHYHRLVARILGIRIALTGTLPQQGPLLIAANHVSWLDIVVLSAVAPVSFIAKKEVKGWPFFGALARLQRSVFVDRGSRRKTGHVRDEIGARLAAGDMLVLFSEGTSGDGASVLPFKTSLFAAAETGAIQVQPVTLAYRGHRNLPMTRRLRPLYAWYGDMALPPHLWRALMTGPIEVVVACHPPLTAAEPRSRKSLAGHAEREVRRGLARALHGRDEMR